MKSELLPELFEAATGRHAGEDFARLLALAIILANPKSLKTPYSRMNIALKALLGDEYSSSTFKLDLRQGLRMMARAYIADRGGKQFSFGPDPFAYLWKNPSDARTVKALAKDAKSKLRLSISASTLENEFSANKKRIVSEETGDNDVVSSIQFEGLKKIQEILRSHGIATDVSKVL